MLLVKTKIGPSAIHGIGLFADQFIQKGRSRRTSETDTKLNG